MKKLTPKKSLSERVADSVSREISEGRFELGTMLSETRISEALGVSRTPVREAFYHLEFRGLLVTKPQSGTYVFEATREEMRNLSEVRSCLEVQGFRLSTRNAGKDMAHCLRELVENMEDALSNFDYQLYEKLDRKFHEAFISFSGNKMLMGLYEPVSLKISALVNNGIMATAITDVAHQEHIHIALSSSRNKFDEAIESVMLHLTKFEEELLE